MMERVAMYLRKSRADLEAEALGEGETLTKHKKTLLRVAKEKQLNIAAIYEEIASGESILHRPEMRKLLHEVEHGLYDAVLVMDMDRLGRGNMQDQGLILDTFKQTKTKIITPRKVYNLDDEFDEEYSEFEAFMARKEFKIIRRRLQSGRLRSVQEGNYVGTRPPYGYEKVKRKDGITLVPHPDQAPVVKKIFAWYCHDNPEERMGTTKIAQKLNQLGIPSYRGSQWGNDVLLQILKNPVYIGKIRWRQVERKKSKDPAKVMDTKIRPAEEVILVDGKHEAIISEALFAKAQEIRKNKRHPRWKPSTTLKNPLAGLIKCGKCGATMTMKPNAKYGYDHLHCNNRGRGRTCNKSSRLEHVEQRILMVLREWLKEYKVTLAAEEYVDDRNPLEIYAVSIKNLKQEISELQTQLSNIHDLLERKKYSEEFALARSATVNKRLTEAQAALNKAIAEYNQKSERIQAKTSIIPRIEHILDVYPKTASAKQKNLLLKSVLDRCIYNKEKHQRNDEFTLVIHPRV